MPVLMMNDLSFYGQECDDYVRQEFYVARSVLVDGSSGISSVAFDDEEELLWVGGHSGLISSFYGLNSDLYSSFQVLDFSEVRYLLTWDQRIISLTSDSLTCSSKFGQVLDQYRSHSVSDLQCALLSPPNHLYLGGLKSNIIEFDLETSTELRKFEIGSTGNVILRFSNSYLCSGSTSGVVSLLDPTSLSVVRTLAAHSGSLSDFDVYGNQLITCGFSLKNGEHIIDRHLMMFDLRYFKAMAPMQVLIDPMYLRFVQTYSNQICIVSQTGQFQVLEQGYSGYQSPIYDVPMFGGQLTSCTISSSNMVLAFGESSGYLHTFVSNHENPVFNHFSIKTEFATADQELAVTGFDYELSNASSYYSEAEYPTWTDPLSRPTYGNTSDTSGPLYHSVMPESHVNAFYSQYPMKSTESQHAYSPVQKAKSNNLTLTGCRSKQGDVPTKTSTEQGSDDQPFAIPKCYRKVEIKYSKYGVDGFDFHSYNKTNFAGLETHIPNAYCNAMIQVLYFVEPLRNSVMSHLCEHEFCLTCELGFLFQMLQQKTTQTCQATNFLRAFRTIPEATALGLVLSDSDEALGKVDLAHLIQSWNRFILQLIDSELTGETSTKFLRCLEQEVQGLSNLSFVSNVSDHCNLLETADNVEVQKLADQKVGDCVNEAKEGLHSPRDVLILPPENRTIVKQLFAYNVSLALSCKICGDSLKRKTSLLIVDLKYPELVVQNKDVVKVPFSKIVERSLNDEHKMRSWCSSCNKYQVHYQHKTLDSLPDILSLHCNLESPAYFAFWKAQEENGPKVNSDVGSNIYSTVKLCRYGSSCTRADCRFRHETSRNSSSVSENFSTSSAKGSWVPFRLKLTLMPGGKVRAADPDGEHSEEEANAEHYVLMASVACIKRGTASGGDHLVSHVMVNEEHPTSGKSKEQWFLFNDFAISQTDRSLAVSFDMDWKLPCLLYFAKHDIKKKYNIPITNPLTSDVLFANESLITPPISNITFMPLQPSELPQEGDIVGLDAEFVKLHLEEAELHSDGTKSTIKPSQMSVARVTCIREKGPLSGVPFIDDYICTLEQVADYLTEFSGIEPGDLDPALSSKYLTTLKTTYLKLQYLITAKVIFVGHGLKKDFRVLNLVVPPEQVVDTVELFHLPKCRMISLKFLAWYFLGMKIQSRNHDSIEDSNTAVCLYYKYLELSAQGLDNLQKELEMLYETGRMLNWHVPDDEKEKLKLGCVSQDLSLT